MRLTNNPNHPMRRISIALIAVACLLSLAGPARAQQMSALIAEAMDKQLPKTDFNFSGTLPQAIDEFGKQTGVRVEADSTVYDALPWGDLTTFQARFQNETLRQALSALSQKLGLEFTVGTDAVELQPMPALRRLGRRSTVEELAAIDLLASTPLNPSETTLAAGKLLEAVDTKLEKSPYAVENRAFAGIDKPTVSIARNATLLDALEEISRQTNATWYPWGKSIVVLSKRDQIRMQLARRITTRYEGVDVTQVLQDLAERSGVEFRIDPGAVQRVPAQFRTVKLVLDNATVQQTMDSIGGFTGLAYAITDDGVKISNPDASTLPAAALAPTTLPDAK
jgi:hypothetical protein